MKVTCFPNVCFIHLFQTQFLLKSDLKSSNDVQSTYCEYKILLSDAAPHSLRHFMMTAGLLELITVR